MRASQFICTQAWEQCNAANENNAQGQEQCTKNIKDHCGTLTPVIPSGSSASSSSGSASGSSPTGSANGSQTGSATAPSATGTSPAVKGAAAAHHAFLLGNGAAIVAAVGLAALL